MIRATMQARLAHWGHELARLRHPGSPPSGTFALTLALLAITLVVIGVLIWHGLIRYDRAAHFFRERRAGNYYSGLQLLASSVVAALLARKAGRHPTRRFWCVIAGTLLALSLDETFGLHEELDVGIHKLMGWHDRRHWLTDHLDDVFVALYGVIAIVWAERHLEWLVRLRWTALMLATAFVCFVGMSVLDFTGIAASLEESLELVAETLILSGLITAYRDPGPTSRT
jgi:hypothetical protein